MTLVLSGLPGRFENFVVQESFNSAANFTELRSRLTNFEDSRKQRNAGDEQHQHVAVLSMGKFQNSKSKSFSIVNRNKAESSKKLSCYCCGKAGHVAKNGFLREKAECGKKGLLDVACRSQLSGKCSVHKRDAQSLHSVYLCSGTNVVSKEKVLIDSGCADHILTERNLFQSFRQMGSKVKNPDGSFAR